MGAGDALACLMCDVEWTGGSPCLSCGGPGVPGRLADYCPHGNLKPYRGWPCAACRTAFIEVHRIKGG